MADFYRNRTGGVSTPGAGTIPNPSPPPAIGQMPTPEFGSPSATGGGGAPNVFNAPDPNQRSRSGAVAQNRTPTEADQSGWTAPTPNTYGGAPSGQMPSWLQPKVDAFRAQMPTGPLAWMRQQGLMSAGAPPQYQQGQSFRDYGSALSGWGNDVAYQAAYYMPDYQNYLASANPRLGQAYNGMLSNLRSKGYFPQFFNTGVF